MIVVDFFRMPHAKVLIDRRLFNQLCEKVQVDEKNNTITGILRASLVSDGSNKDRKRLIGSLTYLTFVLGIDQPARKREKNQRSQSQRVQAVNRPRQSTIKRGSQSRNRESGSQLRRSKSPSPTLTPPAQLSPTRRRPKAKVATASTTDSEKIKNYYFDLNNPLSFSGNIRTLVNSIESLK